MSRTESIHADGKHSPPAALPTATPKREMRPPSLGLPLRDSRAEAGARRHPLHPAEAVQTTQGLGPLLPAGPRRPHLPAAWPQESPVQGDLSCHLTVRRRQEGSLNCSPNLAEARRHPFPAGALSREPAESRGITKPSLLTHRENVQCSTETPNSKYQKRGRSQAE